MGSRGIDESWQRLDAAQLDLVDARLSVDWDLYQIPCGIAGETWVQASKSPSDTVPFRLILVVPPQAEPWETCFWRCQRG
jgi:hypothetical protein